MEKVLSFMHQKYRKSEKIMSNIDQLTEIFFSKFMNFVFFDLLGQIVFNLVKYASENRF